jgi:hypothetical protein
MNKDFTMNELVELWKEFRTHWFEIAPIQKFGNGETGQFKPCFFDFMEWLVKRKLEK